jgi:hypothetical protein
MTNKDKSILWLKNRDKKKLININITIVAHKPTNKTKQNKKN